MCDDIKNWIHSHTSAKHIQLYGVSHLTRIIWSNHLEDYVFIITYLSKLHCNSANCNIHMVISFVFCCVFHFLVFFLFKCTRVCMAQNCVHIIWRIVVIHNTQSVMLLPVLKLRLLLLRWKAYGRKGASLEAKASTRRDTCPANVTTGTLLCAIEFIAQ